jgi:hypothetical protein
MIGCIYSEKRLKTPEPERKFKILPSLTTSKEGLKTHDIHR